MLYKSKFALLHLVTVPAMAAGVPMQIVTAPFGPMAAYGAGSIYVPCYFDAHAENCLIDTGSDSSNIQEDHFSATYPVIGHTTGSGLSGVPTTCDIIEIAQFVVGDCPLGSQKFVRCAANPDSDGSIEQGNVAGLSSFTGKAMQFDFTAKTFSMNGPLPSDWVARPLTIHPKLGHFGFPVQIGGAGVDSIVDTGAAITTIDQNLVSAYPDAFQFVEAISGGVDADGHPITSNLYQVKSVSFGGTTLSNLYAMGTDFSAISQFIPNVSVIFGFNAIAQRNWYFDLSKRIWAAD